ncbi:hypothetical protein Y032_0337g2900 [Ancylostoma ceylanicum]|nr:hypothetical protein Y032_0337g2900 [Ancylostoma ceylanicum]
MQFALVYFRQSETTPVRLSHADVAGNFKLKTSVKARSPSLGRRGSARIRWIVSPALENLLVVTSRPAAFRNFHQVGKAGNLRYDFASEEHVELIRRQKKCKNLLALALEREVYKNLKSDLTISAESRKSSDRVEFVKEALFKYYLVPEKCQRRRGVPSLNELKAAIFEYWERLRPEGCEKYIMCIKRRLRRVVKLRGGNIIEGHETSADFEEDESD